MQVSVNTSNTCIGAIACIIAIEVLTTFTTGAIIWAMLVVTGRTVTTFKAVVTLTVEAVVVTTAVFADTVVVFVSVVVLLTICHGIVKLVERTLATVCEIVRIHNHNDTVIWLYHD